MFLLDAVMAVAGQINDHKLEDRSAQCSPIVSWLFIVTHSLLWQFAVFKCPYHVSLLPLLDEDEVQLHNVITLSATLQK